MNFGKASVVRDSCEDVVAECSSSFGDTGSDTENASFFSDTVVESPMRTHDPSSLMCDDRKKRTTKGVTIHWRRFIRPIMWRCKWIEMQLKQLHSQACKYEEELAAYNHTKQLDFAHLNFDDSDVKAVPITGRMHKNKAMKRNRRERVEEMCDLASYMSNHSLFSYYEKTNCTADTCLKDLNDVGIGGDNGNSKDFMMNHVWSSVDRRNVDKSLNDIIQQIEAIQSQVQKLKSRTDTLQSKFRMGDLLMPGNATSLEGITTCIETTDRPELDDLCKDVSFLYKSNFKFLFFSVIYL
ncbi:uncharacterized protein LOC113851434 [Abrus precatorius]|uniref:Uncharacterized protein LOC113851434 n=1 Tax=Abrus precatorius TaxID=3816 RepID=A0A8B8K3T1_ABRPR|nr:uncharacterized protein LOC113851434 [Abrus precatorius]